MNNLKRTLLTTIAFIAFVNLVIGQCRYTVSTSCTVSTSSSGVTSVCRSMQVESVEAYDIESADVQPAFPGGISALYSYINNSRRYPAEAYRNGVQGRVLCSFVVNADGSISHINVLKGIDPALDNEAIRIIEEMPRWSAGRIGERTVPVYYILPIVFRI